MQLKPSNLHTSITKALALSACMTIGFAANAQEVESEEDQGLLEKITVTAQKRTQNLNEVPVAVSVLREDQINASFSANLEGLEALIPSVSFSKGNTTRNSAITIRGIGTISFSIAAEPSVSTVVDGVVLGRSGQAFVDLYDLERIEVLRGPQGTLFGKNASAGVVNMTTKRPSDVFEGSFETTLFQDNEYRIKASVSGPLNDNVSGSLTVLKSHFDGSLKNEFTNQTTNGYDKEGVRAMLDIETNSDADILFIFENVKSNDNCCTLVSVPTDDDGNFDFSYRTINHDYETRTEDEVTAFSMQVNKPIGDHELTSITAYREWYNTEFREGDYSSTAGDSPFPVNFSTVQFQLHDIGPQQWRQTSQELRIASPLGNALEYQVGFFWWTQESERNFTRDASCQNNGGQFQTAIGNYLTDVLGVASPSDADIEQFISDESLTCNANDIVSATAYMATKFDNWAVFADGSYNFTDDLRLLFGIRYTDDEVSFSHKRSSNDQYSRTGVGVRSFDTDFAGKTDETDVSGKLGVQFDLTDDSMTYFTYSQGYKGPAFNVFYNMFGGDLLPIGAETSDAYELGYKYASRDLVFNAAVFRTEIDGFQANNPEELDGVFITRLTNAGSVITEGFEVDVLWQATDELSISGGLAAVDAVIDQFLCPVGLPDCEDSSGEDLPFGPDLKYSVSAEYVLELEDTNVYFNTSYIYTDEIYSGAPGSAAADNGPAGLPSHGILNGSIAFSFDDDQYRISLIGKNLTDEKYVSAFGGGGNRYFIPRNADRHIGIQLRANF
jgi:iron complex outermembrane receptor protein